MQRQCAIYVRSATGDELAMKKQERVGRGLCEAVGWKYRIFRDKCSGMRRGAGMKRLLELARKRKIEHVFVASLDRLSRDLRQAYAILGLLESKRIKLWFCEN